MAVNARYRVPFRRRKEGKTNYRLRGRLLRSGKPRACIRCSLRHSYIQLIHYTPEGDEVLVSASSRELEKYGWKSSCPNVPTVYLTGVLAAHKASSRGIQEAVLDIGLKNPTRGNRAFAGLKGLLDGGLNVPHSADIFPPANRIAGDHLKSGAGDTVEKVKKTIMEG